MDLGEKVQPVADPEPSQLSPEAVMQAWTQRWGKLREEHRRVFLQRPEVDALCLLPPASVVQAIEHHRSLDAILHAADDASPRGNSESTDVHGVEESVPTSATNAAEAKASRATASSPSPSATGKPPPGAQPVVSAAKAGGRQQPKTRATKRAKRKRPATGTQPRKPRGPEHTDRDAFTSERYAGANTMRRQGRPEADLREQCSSCGRLVAPGEAHDC